MAQIITNIPTENPQSKFHFNNQNVDLKDVKESGLAIDSEADFAEIHASFKIQYEQFLTETNHEISKCAQKLLELKSIVYGNPSSE